MRLLLAIGLVVIGLQVAGHLFPDPLPRCYEDEVLYRQTVPGQWECIALDDLVKEVE